MNGKTIVIDPEAYSRIEQARGKGETASDVIKRFIRPVRSVEEILRVMQKARISTKTIEAIDESAIRRRRLPSTGR